jgi:hypothetical protein
MWLSLQATKELTMSPKTMIVELLDDAEHISRANNFTVLAYLIGMAREHAQTEFDMPRPQEQQEEELKATGT